MKYYLQARLFPTVITSIPVIGWTYELFNPYTPQLRQTFEFLPHAMSATFYTAILFMLVQINRIVSKEIFQAVLYKDDIYMPTTTQLLISDSTLDPSIKVKVREKIESTFGIQLFSEDEEQADNVAARKRIASAVGQVRNKLRSNLLLLQHNIEYGFFRNLMGGSLIAAVVSVGLSIYCYFRTSSHLLGLALGMSIFYSLLLLITFPLLKKSSKYYTRILLDEFIGL